MPETPEAQNQENAERPGKIGIVMGSKSDYALVQKAEQTLSAFGVAYETRILSAHRTPEEARDFALSAAGSYDVLIAAAGKSAHLAGVLAASTALPVIGLPVATSFMGGLDSLLSIVQMPKGVPVATVGVDGAENAAILAVQILALKEPGLFARLADYKESMRAAILEDDEALGHEN